MKYTRILLAEGSLPCCEKCGAAVFDTTLHDKWHAQLARLAVGAERTE